MPPFGNFDLDLAIVELGHVPVKLEQVLRRLDELIIEALDVPDNGLEIIVGERREMELPELAATAAAEADVVDLEIAAVALETDDEELAVLGNDEVENGVCGVIVKMVLPVHGSGNSR